MDLPEILDKQEETLEINKLKEEKEIIRSVLLECKNKHLLPLGYNEKFLISILLNYISLRKKSKEKEMELILNKYNFNYITSIKLAINILLNDFSSNTKKKVKYLPGIIDINKVNDLYIVETTLGEVYVKRAEKIINSDVFNKELRGMCYERTLDFLYEDTTYKAVMGYCPNYFNIGHFHAYLKKDNIILDIANNALYFKYPKNFFDKTIAMFSLEEIKKEYEMLTREDDYPKYYKLHTLGLYHTYKDNFKG